jgi:hypothetical protein
MAEPAKSCAVNSPLGVLQKPIMFILAANFAAGQRRKCKPCLCLSQLSVISEFISESAVFAFRSCPSFLNLFQNLPLSVNGKR